MAREDGKLEVNGITYDVVTLDYETFFGKDYTLSGKINTSEYVRDDRFHVHGVAIKKGNGKTLWYTGRNIALALKEIDWSKTAMVGHNTAFDGFITSEVYGHKPAFYVDTLSMSRATRGHATRHDLDTVAKAFGHGGKVKRDALANTKDKVQLTKNEEAKLGGYAVDDVDDTYKIFWDMYPHVPDDELRLIDITMRMFCDPVLEIDIPRVKAELENELGAKAAALLRSGAQVDDLMSNDKFARLLQAAGAQLPKKISPSTGKVTYAFAKSDLAFQDLMKNGSDKVRALCEARLKVKSTIGETRANRFLEAGRDGMKLPVLLNYSGAHTHRWCVPGDTEVLTPDGWVRLENWQGGVIAQFDPSTSTTTWAKATNNEFSFSGKLITADGRFCKGAFTAEHKLARVTTKGNFSPILAKDAVGINIRMSTPTKIVGENDVVVDPNEVRLFVAAAADGSIDNIAKRLAFKLKKQRKIDRLRSIVKALNLNHKEYDCSDGYTAIYISLKELPEYVRQCKTPDAAQILGWTADARAVFIDELRYWDGVFTDANIKFVTTNKAMAETVSAVTTSVGLLPRTTFTPRSQKNPNWSDRYDVTIRRHDWVGVPSYAWGTESFNGTVYCPTTETGYFVVRSRGTVFVTGNSGGNKMNLQNLKRGGELRRSILAPKGHVVVVADSAQIEARVLAWLSQQMDIVNAFATKQDVYKLMASAIYGVPVEQITKDQRFIGKICVLGLGYGMGPQKLQQTLKQGTMGPSVDISEDECRRIVQIYRQKNWKIKAFWKKMDQVITNMTLGIESKEGPLEIGKGFIRLPNGMFLQYFGLHGTAEITRDDLVMTETTYLTRTGRTKLYGGLLTENVVQALSRIIIAEQMLKIQDAGYRIVTMTHDEIVIIAKKKDAKKALDFMIKTMSTPPDWAPGLPLAAEGDFDDCYSK